ncbi:hypothetical protein DFP72DRAFT_261701 [Ephemerocybe angulata]|uniref:F-box domain-containing protein n=1 Tax=Ephemerocybe angulata TaxID=980116 RepID=A0A8H6I1C0_9AGAR|nr:hypothetical protein DFP72DRAFT_261701 [Tulosesus angulatus]
MSMWSTRTQHLLQAQDNSDRPAHCTKLDHRVFELEVEIRAIKSFRNTLAPINGIPPEILSIIFIIVAHCPQSFLDLETRGPYVDTTWIQSTSHVCRQWREVALVCPALWARISFASPEITELMLLRSKDAPLSIVYNESHQTFPHHVLQALFHSHRLKAIELRSDYYQSSSLGTLLTHHSRPMPILQSLKLRDMVGSGFHFPGRFFPEGAPALRYLEARGCNISHWQDLPLGTNLTTLHLEAHRTSNRPTVEEFHGALVRVPCLLELSLINILPVDEGRYGRPISQRLAPILPALRVMHLEDTSAALSTLFLYFHIPPCDKLEVFNNETVNDDGAIVDLIAQLGSSWRPDVHCGTLSIFGSFDGFQFNQQTYDVSLKFHQDEGRLGSERSLHLNLSGAPGATSGILSSFRWLLGPTALHSFTGNNLRLPVPAWNMLLQQLQLAEIRIEKTAFGGFIDALIQSSAGEHQPQDHSNSGDGKAGPPPFPSLSCLCLKDIHFQIYEFGLMESGLYKLNDANAAVMSLVDCLKRYPMRKISIDHCYGFTRAHWRIMQQEFPGAEVIWDKYENAHGSELGELLEELRDLVQEWGN